MLNSILFETPSPLYSLLSLRAVMIKLDLVPQLNKEWLDLQTIIREFDFCWMLHISRLVLN